MKSLTNMWLVRNKGAYKMVPSPLFVVACVSGEHIVGMFFFKTDALQLKELLSLLIENKTGKKFASYTTITPDEANLPEDILQAISLEVIQNSA